MSYAIGIHTIHLRQTPRLVAAKRTVHESRLLSQRNLSPLSGVVASPQRGRQEGSLLHSPCFSMILPRWAPTASSSSPWWCWMSSSSAMKSRTASWEAGRTAERSPLAPKTTSAARCTLPSSALDCPGFMYAVGNHIPSNVPVENAMCYIEYLNSRWNR